jgi:3-deoxy-D-manno-octulosonic-acid transferase
MHVLYNFGICLFSILLRIISPFHAKARMGVLGRKNWKSKLEGIPKNKKVIWFHCASLGEFDQGLPVMNSLKLKNPELFLLVTFFSPSGMLHYNKRSHVIDLAMYLPYDTPRNVDFFIKKVNPTLVFFVKYEFWQNYIRELYKKNIKLISLATLLRPNQHFFKWYGGFFREGLKKISYYFTQNEETKQLLNTIGIHEIAVVGDTRYDRVSENKKLFLETLKSARNNETTIFESFLAQEKALIFGSSWGKELAILDGLLKDKWKGKIIIAPHNVSESNVKNIQLLLGEKAIKYTEFKNYKEEQVLILDTIGQLSTAYYYGDIACIGGGFSGNLHNILEPAVFGLPVLFGSNHSKFPEADEFIEGGIGFEFNDFESFKNQLSYCLENNAALNKKTLAFMAERKGVCEKILSSPIIQI